MKLLRYFIYPKRFPKKHRINIKELILLLVFVLLLGYGIADPCLKEIDGSVNMVSVHTASLLLMFSGVLIAPFFEEFVHRAFLTGKAFYFIPFLISILYFSIRLSYIFDSTIPCYIGGALVFFLIWVAFVSNNLRLLITVFRSNFIIYFYSVAVVFALMHLTSSDLEKGLSFCLCKLFIDLFPGALVLGYIRTKYGLLSSIVFHSTHNIFVLLLNEWVYL